MVKETKYYDTLGVFASDSLRCLPIADPAGLARLLRGRAEDRLQKGRLETPPRYGRLPRLRCR